MGAKKNKTNIDKTKLNWKNRNLIKPKSKIIVKDGGRAQSSVKYIYTPTTSKSVNKLNHKEAERRKEKKMKVRGRKRRFGSVSDRCQAPLEVVTVFGSPGQKLWTRWFSANCAAEFSFFFFFLPLILLPIKTGDDHRR